MNTYTMLVICRCKRCNATWSLELPNKNGEPVRTATDVCAVLTHVQCPALPCTNKSPDFIDVTGFEMRG